MQLWITLPIGKRTEIKNEHKIRGSGKVEIVNNAVSKDGVLEQDLVDLPREVLLKAHGQDVDLPDPKQDEEKETGEKIEEHKEEVKKEEGEAKTGIGKYFK